VTYQPYRPKGKRGHPALSGPEPTLEDLMAELFRNEREQAASDAADRLLGRIGRDRKAVRVGGSEQ
jgi:hypothetical protein